MSSVFRQQRMLSSWYAFKMTDEEYNFKVLYNTYSRPPPHPEYCHIIVCMHCLHIAKTLDALNKFGAERRLGKGLRRKSYEYITPSMSFPC